MRSAISVCLALGSIYWSTADAQRPVITTKPWDTGSTTTAGSSQPSRPVASTLSNHPSPPKTVPPNSTTTTSATSINSFNASRPVTTSATSTGSSNASRPVLVASATSNQSASPFQPISSGANNTTTVGNPSSPTGPPASQPIPASTPNTIIYTTVPMNNQGGFYIPDRFIEYRAKGCKRHHEDRFKGCESTYNLTVKKYLTIKSTDKTRYKGFYTCVELCQRCQKLTASVVILLTPLHVLGILKPWLSPLSAI
ncbi:uncharacterized protein LOC142357802 [Convolutriloba macropyga]|uniref:uncharacterized protein LOC142357802 n=1 Tax=Convolutriloba macropyga TaxID=536237 RepID=UPI003F51ECEF